MSVAIATFAVWPLATGYAYVRGGGILNSTLCGLADTAVVFASWLAYSILSQGRGGGGLALYVVAILLVGTEDGCDLATHPIRWLSVAAPVFLIGPLMGLWGRVLTGLPRKSQGVKKQGGPGSKQGYKELG